MDQQDGVRRRGFLRLAALSGLGAAAVATVAGAARADTETQDHKRQARYQPNAPDVQTYYRVNRYPAGS